MNTSNRSRALREERTLFAGIDVGGTKVHVVLARPNGRIVARVRRKVRGERGFPAVLRKMLECLDEVCAAAKTSPNRLAGVGVGVPSAVRADGTAVHAPNLGWRNAPVERRLSAILSVPVLAANDCDLGTLGEYVFGAGRGSRTLAGLFVGTGLGGGIVYQGNLLRGENRMAAELGHMVVAVDGRVCGCGHRGCLEAYASKAGMGRRFKSELKAGTSRSILREESGDLANVRSSVLRRGYLEGDRVICEGINEAARYLGIGVANIITLLGPDRVVLGGGVMEALGRKILPIVRRAAREHTFPPASFRDTRIVLSELGDDAVALGAVAYARASVV